MESLPDFFQALVAVRGEKANTCLFVERYHTNHCPAGTMEYDFVWTTQLLKDIKHLSLGGEDSAVVYATRSFGVLIGTHKRIKSK
jgi:hypothetical protein